jgi:hypothetical protein
LGGNQTSGVFLMDEALSILYEVFRRRYAVGERIP